MSLKKLHWFKKKIKTFYKEKKKKKKKTNCLSFKSSEMVVEIS